MWGYITAFSFGVFATAIVILILHNHGRRCPTCGATEFSWLPDCKLNERKGEKR